MDIIGINGYHLNGCSSGYNKEFLRGTNLLRLDHVDLYAFVFVSHGALSSFVRLKTPLPLLCAPMP